MNFQQVHTPGQDYEQAHSDDDDDDDGDDDDDDENLESLFGGQTYGPVIVL